jgi:hypothetical protein
VPSGSLGMHERGRDEANFDENPTRRELRPLDAREVRGRQQRHQEGCGDRLCTLRTARQTRRQAMCAQLIAHEYMQAAQAHHDDDDERRAKSIFCSAQVSAWVH